MISYWAFSSLINLITSAFLGFFVFSKNKKRALNVTYALFCLSASIWSFSYFFWQVSTAGQEALFWCRALMAGAIFIPVFYLHHLLYLMRIAQQRRGVIHFCYGFGLVFFFVNFTPLFVKSVSPKMWFSYWPDAGLLFLPFCVVWFWICLYGIWLLAKHVMLSAGERKTQLRYVLTATLIGWLGAFTNFPLWFDIPIPPIGNIFVSVYISLVAYAIIKYQLLDIRIAFTRAGIFIFVYTLVLGIPFGVGMKYLGSGLWLMPVSLMAVFATIGPFIYLFIQKRAEEALLQEQRQYQMTLQQASLGMGQIKELKRLLKLVVHIITKAVSVEHAEVYLLHEESGQFTLKASRGWKHKNREQVSVMELDSPLVVYLKEYRKAVICEEIEQYVRDNDAKEFKEIADIMKQLDSALIVPSFIDQKLIAILILGNKKAKKSYTKDDMAVFTILANQAGLAIENAQFYERMKETHSQLIKAEKMATVGTMADGLSHQINNRLHAMGFIAGDALDTIRSKKKEKNFAGMEAFLDEIEFSLSRIEDNVKRGGEIVEGLLKYTRKGSEGFEEIGFDKLLDSAVEMAQFKIKLNQIRIVRNFEKNIPGIKGNFTQLQEVFFNVIDNAYDAMMQRKEELNEDGYKPTLEFFAARKGWKLEIVIKDNGIGVKPENIEKLFTPFFTTKLSSKKGTGLGLYVIRQIIEENHGGQVKFTSLYKEGSQTVILLPSMVEG
ncbi:MAG: GAF domain-containing protein [Candidatus Omnitrophica bacterium]|nr:GAF domain-containing protein [Candidatus Omnitrophota bacterium]